MGPQRKPRHSPDPNVEQRTVVTVVPDLLMATRIAETGRRVGVQVLATDSLGLIDACNRARPSLIVIDLEAPGALPDALRSLRRNPDTRETPVIGFYPHVRAALRNAALEAGANRALPRSSFHARLAELLSSAPSDPPGAR